MMMVLGSKQQFHICSNRWMMDDDDGWSIDAYARWMKNYGWLWMMMDDYWWMMMQVALCLDGRAGGQADRQEASKQGVCSSGCDLSVPCSVHDSPAQQVRSHASSAVCPVLCDGSIDCGFITLTHGLVNHHVATRCCSTGWPYVSQTRRPGISQRWDPPNYL